jgi:hypothetical protein
MNSPKIAPFFVVFIISSLAFITACQMQVGNGIVTAPQSTKQSDKPKEPKETVKSDDPIVQAFSDKVQGLINQRDFQALEVVGSDLVKTRERFKGGGWTIFSFDRLVESPVTDHPDDAAWESHIKFLHDWTERMPKSILAQTALANAYIVYGWAARGEGYASTVNQDNAQRFAERLDKAEAAAKAASRLEAKYTGYYDLLLKLGISQGWDRESFNLVFDKAIRFEPRYQYFYTRKAIYLLPRWNGEPGEWEDFANRVKTELGQSEGLKMYFMIVAEVGDYHGRNFFETNRVSWEDTKKGFELYTKEFGANRRNLNQFGKLANHANDAKVSCDIFSQLQGENDFEPAIWDNRKKFEAYRKMSLEFCKIPKFDNQAK